jgi:type I restriction enzyme S subunit
MNDAATSIAEEIGSRWKPYPVYKDSGVKWLGEIPEHWAILRTKSLERNAASLAQTGPFGAQLHASDYLDKSEDGVPLILIKNVNNLRIVAENMPKISFEKAEQLASYRLEPGDIVFSRVGSVGRIALAGEREKGWLISGQMLRLRFKNVKLHLPFALYAISSSRVLSYFDLTTVGTTRDSINTDILRGLPISIPPKSEQRTIASFLDRETAHIDTLIAKKERLIELLTEKRSALISHAVTKGLDPTVPMKDPGVEWIGEIPAHWEVVPLRAVLKQRGEYNIGPQTTNILSVVKDVGVINYDEREASGNKKSENVEQYKIIHKGDLVVNRMNVIIGSVGISPEYGTASIEYYVLYANDNNTETEYYGHIFCSKAFQTNLARLGSGILGHRLRIPFDILKTEMLPKPPINEQKSISTYLNELRNTDSVVTQKVQQAIAVLKEYRTAIISAAVTGKIDVREEVP